MDQNRRQIERAKRVPYEGMVRLIVPFGHLQIMAPLRGINLSESGLMASLDVSTLSRILGNCQPPDLVAAGDSCRLQLEHNFDHLPPLMIEAVMARRVHAAHSWQMAFAFASSHPELSALLHNLHQDHYETAPQGLH